MEIADIRCTSTVSMYQDSFSCRIAFVARAFLPGCGASDIPLALFTSSVLVVLAGRTTSDRSLTISKVLGFSR